MTGLDMRVLESSGTGADGERVLPMPAEGRRQAPDRLGAEGGRLSWQSAMRRCGRCGRCKTRCGSLVVVEVKGS